MKITVVIWPWKADRPTTQNVTATYIPTTGKLLAVHPMFNPNGNLARKMGWSVTHVPTGHMLSGPHRYKKDAVRIGREVAQVIDLSVIAVPEWQEGESRLAYSRRIQKGLEAVPGYYEMVAVLAGGME